MTAQEYNHVFLPQINRAEEFVELFETSLDKGTQRKTTENELPSLTQCTA